MARRKVSDELSREMIIAEAHKQLQNSTFEKVTTRSIAKNLGCSHGAIYYHFANKTELFYAVVEQYFNELNAILDSILCQTGERRERTIKVFIKFIEFGLNYQSQYNFMFMRRDADMDPLSHKSSLQSYMKFKETILVIHDCELDENDIYSCFLSIHGFVSHYHGRIENYLEAEEAAMKFAEFLYKALVK